MMKAAWAVGAAALISVPILALPAGTARAPDTGRQAVSELGAPGDHLITSCPQGYDRGAVTVERLELGKGLSLRPKPAMPCRVDYRSG